MEEGLWVPTSFSSPHFEKLSQPLPQGPLWEERGVGLEGPRVFSAFRLPLLAQVCSTLLPTAFFAMSCSRFWFAASFCQALFLVVAFLVCAPYIIAVFTLILLATWFVAVHLSVSCPPLSLLGLHGRVNTMCGGEPLLRVAYVSCFGVRGSPSGCDVLDRCVLHAAADPFFLPDV